MDQDNIKQQTIMNILSKIFSSGATELVKGIGGVIDNLHTSKEENILLNIFIIYCLFSTKIFNYRLSVFPSL